jgi:hypothetical protein
MKAWLLLLLMVAVGCEVDTRTEDVDGTSGTPDTDHQTGGTPTNDATATAEAAAQAEWDSIKWHTGSGPNCQGARKVMTLTSAKITSGGSKVSFAWDRYPWSGMGLAHFFVWNGSGWSGGKFDWIRQGGQSTKLLENVREGYNGLRAPPSGTRVAFAWTSGDGKQRSNMVYTTWP